METEITSYPAKASWEDIFERLIKYEDDGHAVKLGRAVRYGEILTEQAKGNGEDTNKLPIQGDMWEKIGNMIVDSVEDSGDTVSDVFPSFPF